MADIWFVLDDRGRLGPLTQSQLIQTLETYPDRNEVFVQRGGQKSWQRASDVTELSSLYRDRPIVALSPNVILERKIDQINSTRIRRAKWRWTRTGAVIGFGLSAIDQWLFINAHGITPQTVGEAIGALTIATTLFAFAGFVCGTVRDILSKPSANQPITHNFSEAPLNKVAGAVADVPSGPAQQSRTGNKFNVVAMHWRGLYPLWISYWVISVVVSLVVVFVAILIAAAFTPKSGYDPLAIFATMISLWLFILAVVIWQVVGVWRSANNHIARRASIGKKSPWAGLAMIAVIVNVLQFGATFISSALPQLWEATRMAFMGDPDIPEYSFRIMRNGTEVEITGGFKYGLTDEFRKLLKASRQIRVVHLDSIGGRLGEAEKLYKVIQENALITYVPSKCASACTLAFAGGKQRYVARGAVLGFHGPAFPGMDKKDLVSSIAEQSEIFKAAGFSPVFVTRALNTPTSELWKPILPELLEAKAITGISDGTQFASSGWGEITKETMASKLTADLPVLAALKGRLPKSYDVIVDAYYTSYVAGKTEAEMIAAARAKFVPLLRSLTPLADDEVLVDLARLYADEYQALWLKGGAAPCYLYASGTGDRSFSDDLPAVLVKRELELDEHIVRTAAKRASASETTLELIRAKLRNLMITKGLTAETIELLQATTVPPSRQGEYCIASIGLYQAISNLPQRDAATLLRYMWTDK